MPARSIAKRSLYEPDHRGAINNLGVVALEQGKLEEAETLFRIALTRDPRNAKTHYLLAKVLLQRGDLVPARLEIEHALTLSPRQPEFADLRNEIEKAAPR